MTLSLRSENQLVTDSGWLPDQLSSHMENFVEVLRYRSQIQPNQVAYTFFQGDAETDSVTYAELDLKVRAIAAYLQAQLPRNCRVLLAYQPSLEFALAFWACLYAGIVAVPAYAPRRNQKASRLRSIVANADIEFALTTAQSVSTFQQFCRDDSVLSQLTWLVTDQVESHVAEQWQPLTLSPDRLAFLQYTSGSTGNPKGVMVSHRNLMTNSAAINQGFQILPRVSAFLGCRLTTIWG